MGSLGRCMWMGTGVVGEGAREGGSKATEIKECEVLAGTSSHCEAACSLWTDATATIAVQDPFDPQPYDKMQDGNAGAVHGEAPPPVLLHPHEGVTFTPNPLLNNSCSWQWRKEAQVQSWSKKKQNKPISWFLDLLLQFLKISLYFFSNGSLVRTQRNGNSLLLRVYKVFECSFFFSNVHW